MDKETLRKVQLTQLEILSEVKRVCENHGIQYWMTYGTLLGAVRHKGFIPWDDDLDIGMLRDDYEKFLTVAEQSLDSRYFLQTWNNDPYYQLPFAKVRKKNTKYVEFQFRNSKANGGIYIDIFPYDNYGDNLIQGVRLKAIKLMMLSKCGFKSWIEPNGINYKKYFIHIPTRVLSLLFSRKALIDRYHNIATQYNTQETKYLFSQGFDHYKTSLIPKEMLNEYCMLPFENGYFSAPNNYEEYLRINYGDFMVLPPETERENRHEIMEVKF